VKSVAVPYPSKREEAKYAMAVGRLELLAAAALLASCALLLSAEGAAESPLLKLEIEKFTCDEFAAVERPEQRERLLVYMNGYLDGMRKATIWDAELVGKRIDEALRLCTANPKSTLLSAFERAWGR
jgi:HdeA/HdeB family